MRLVHFKGNLCYTIAQSYDFPEDINNIYITPDLTPKEQEHNKALRSKLSEMNKDGNRYRIKNGQIVQREMYSHNYGPLH